MLHPKPKPTHSLIHSFIHSCVHSSVNWFMMPNFFLILSHSIFSLFLALLSSTSLLPSIFFFFFFHHTPVSHHYSHVSFVHSIN
ncbi:hypothetical protein IWX91DRAFT_327836, partial [Phyllosticta citricarpa]